MYADDTTFYIAGKNIQEINDKLRDDMASIETWCERNKMVINASKTKTMIIGSRQRLSTLGTNVLSIDINDMTLQDTSCEKMLGVIIDKELTWHDHVDNVCKIVNSKLALLRRIKPFIDTTTRISFYNGYILPILDYCSILWGTCNVGDLNMILRLQKTAARVILDAGFECESDELFKILGWQPFDKRIKARRLIMLYKCLNGLAPQYLRDLFQYTHNVHTYCLRSKTFNHLFVSGGRTEYHKRRFTYLASREWNELPDECRNAKSLNHFKSLINSYL